jgi:hypothetical protein
MPTNIAAGAAATPNTIIIVIGTAEAKMDIYAL